MSKLSQVIEELEKEAQQREHQAQHGSSVSSMAEDAGEGMVAKAIRDILKKLKEVTEL